MDNKVKIRDNIQNIEDSLIKLSGKHDNISVGDDVYQAAQFKHTFADGVYLRQMDIKQGMVVIGKIHKTEHVVFLLEGEISVSTEDGIVEMKGPCMIKSPAGIKRMVYAHSDCKWINVHPNPDNTKDLDKLESDLIATSYLEYKEFKRLQITKNK